MAVEIESTRCHTHRVRRLYIPDAMIILIQNRRFGSTQTAGPPHRGLKAHNWRI